MAWRELEEWVSEVLGAHGGQVWPGEFEMYYDTNNSEHMDLLTERLGYRLRGAAGACIGFDGMVAFSDGTVAPLQIKYTASRYLTSSLGSMWREAFLLQRALGQERVRSPIVVTTAHKLPKHQKNSVVLFAMPELLEWQLRFSMPFSAPENYVPVPKRVRAALRSADPDGELVQACKQGHLDVVRALAPCRTAAAGRKCVRLTLMNNTDKDSEALLAALCPPEDSSLARYVLLQTARFKTMQVHSLFSQRHQTLAAELSGRLSLYPHLKRLYPSAYATKADRVSHACFMGSPESLPPDPDPFDLSCGYAEAAAEGHVGMLAFIDSMCADEIDSATALRSARDSGSALSHAYIMRAHYRDRPPPPSARSRA